MTNQTEQSQKSGNNSINIQIHNNGLSLSETQELVKKEVEEKVSNLLSDNLIRLREEALACANSRANEFAQIFFDKLTKLSQSVLNQVTNNLKNPSIQMSILEAQKGYIKNGTQDKLELLSSLLKDKVVESNNTLKNYLIDDAIVVVPKLTKEQIDFLTCIMIINTTTPKVTDFISFKNLVLDVLVSVTQNIKISDNDLSYLSQLGCLENNLFQARFGLYEYLVDRYKGLFAAGFDKTDLNSDILDKLPPKILIPCLNNTNKHQIGYLNEEVLGKELKKYNFSSDEIAMIKKYFNKVLSKEQIKIKIEELEPRMSDISTLLDRYEHIFITPLGILIAITNYREKFKKNISWDF